MLTIGDSGVDKCECFSVAKRAIIENVKLVANRC